MPDPSSISRYEDISNSARGRIAASHRGKRRVIVQVGHCGASVGAADIVPAISERFGDAVSVTVSGCDGGCFAAPTVLVETPGADCVRIERVSSSDLDPLADALASDSPSGAPTESEAFIASQHRIALDGCGTLDAESIDGYLVGGGYSALARALDAGEDWVIQEMKNSRLRGRGGAYFPAGLKWESARGFASAQRYMIANCEEGEPGLFKDRHLMEGVPHRVIEGALIGAFATGASKVVFYINAEANVSAARMEAAIQQAEDIGLIGEGVLGSAFDVSAEIRRGAGGYVCGDETTLLNTLEGYRREPRLKPPFPTESGLWGQPTVINNAETLASVPFIVNEGADEFAAIGDGQDTGTKIINLSGSVRRPGLIEVPFGATLREIVHGAGGGPPHGRALKMVGVGGPSSGALPASMLDTPIKPGYLHESGVMLGAGGVIAIDDSMSARAVVRNLARYNANESCGKCTPCREGTPRMVEMLDALADGRASSSDVDELTKLARLVNAASLCGLGQAAGNPVLSGLHFFGEELAE